MNDLIPAGGLPLTTPATDTTLELPRYTPGLRKLLLDGEAVGAVRIIAINPVLRAECEAVLPVIRATLAPASDATILEILVRREAHFGIPAAPAAVQAERYGDYLDVLEGLPSACLMEAFRMWNRGEMYPDQPGRHAFYPRAVEVRTLAVRAQSLLGQAQHRAKLALEYVEKAAPKRIDPEERKRVGEMMRGLSRELGSPGSKIDMESRRIIR